MAGASRAGPSVGIDLGTANLLVGVWQNDNVTILEDSSGGRLLPAYVAFTASGRLMGDAAKQQVARNAPNTVFGILHLIGRKFSDPKAQENINRWPFKVVCDAEGKPKVVVQFNGERRALHPVEILAIMLFEIREAATAFIGKDVRNAVLTVPAYFNYSQRQAIKDAGEVAGLNVMRLISGPTAASIAYGLDRAVKTGQRVVLVFDLGAGKLDVSLVAIEEDIYEVLSTAGNINLGGDDFDTRLVEHCATEFRRTHNRDLHSNGRAMTRLAIACERSKRTLSASQEDLIQLAALHDGIDLRVKTTNALLEELCADLLDEVLLPVQQVLSAANVLRSKVDDVVLVGGSTRLPKVEQLLTSFFNGKTLAKCPRCEEVAVHGATVLAAMLTEELSSVRSLGEFMVLDVMPLPLGVEIDGRNPVVMIPRNTTIPTKKTRTFPRSADSQSVVRIQLFEGESDNIGSHPLGKLHVLDLPHKSCGESEIEVTFDIDPNSVLRVWVVDKSSGRKKQLAVDDGRLAPSEIERMSSDVRRRTADAVHDEAKAALEEYAKSVRNGAARRIVELKRSLEDAEAANHTAAETLRWLGSSRLTSKQEFEVKRRKLEEAATPVTPTSNAK